MMIIAMIIFAFCTWAVFSKHFCDGVVTKHFLTFAAITAMLTILNPENVRAGLASAFFLIAGMAYWGFKHRKAIREHLHLLAD